MKMRIALFLLIMATRASAFCWEELCENDDAYRKLHSICCDDTDPEPDDVD